MFHIGDKVTSKKTGLPVVGIVIAIFDPQYYCAVTGHIRSLIWERHYPDWKNNIIILIKFPNPQRPFSLEEFKLTNPDIPEEDIQFRYDMIAAHSVSYYPIDDLELVESNATYAR